MKNKQKSGSKAAINSFNRSTKAVLGSAVAYLCLTSGAVMAEEDVVVSTSSKARSKSTLSADKSTTAKSRSSKAKNAEPVAPSADPAAASGDGFAAYDWDGDGNISREEWAKGPKPAEDAAAGAAAGAAAAGAAATDAATEATDAANAAEQAAAGKAEANPKQLGEVTVTAQRRKESAQKVPTAITVLGGQRIIDQGIGRSASEILNYVPNASAGTQQHGRPRWWIRGLGTGQQNLDLTNPVGFYSDDVYISNSTSTGFPLFDLERVEVLSGPQGTLWGKNTTGGAINVISRKPSFASPNGYLKLGYGTYNDVIAEGAYGGAVSDTLALRGAFHYQTVDGRFNTQDPVTNRLTGEKQGASDDAMFRISALQKITPDLEALFNVHYRDYTNQGGVSAISPDTANGSFRDPLTGYTVTPSTDINVISTARRLPITSNHVQQAGTLLNLKQKFGDYELVGITGYEDWSSTTSGSAPAPQNSWQVSEEIRLTSPRADRWNWITGFHYFKEKIDSDTFTSTLPCGVGLTTTQIQALPNGGGCLSSLGTQAYSHNKWDHEDESFAIFASNTYNFTEQLLATLGVRYTHETKDLNFFRQQASVTPTGGTLNYNSALTSGGVVGNGAVTSNPLFYDANNWWSSVNPAYLGTPVVLNAANLATSGSATSFTGSESAAWDLWTYDITPEYKITKDAMVYFKHAKGAKSGGFNTAATQLAAINTIIKPESIFSYELGAKTTWFEGRLKANTALFYYDYSNDQLNITAVPDPSIPNNRTGYIYNVKSAHSQGAEFSVEALPIPDLHIWANVGLLDTRFDDVSNINQGTVTDTRTLIQEGNDFVRSPHVTSFLQADYRIPYELPGDTHLILSGDWRFQDKQYYYVNYQDNSPLSSKLWQSPYSLVNFRVTLASKDDKYNIVAYVNNAFDEVYRNHTNTPSAGNLNGATLTWGQPQTAGVQVTARFW